VIRQKERAGESRREGRVKMSVEILKYGYNIMAGFQSDPQRLLAQSAMTKYWGGSWIVSSEASVAI